MTATRSDHPRLERLRNLMAEQLQPIGFQVGQKSLHLDIESGLRVTISVLGGRRGKTRGLTAALAAYQNSEWLRLKERSSIVEYDAFNHGELVSGIGFGFGDLMDRPHDHVWTGATLPDFEKAARDIKNIFLECSYERLDLWHEIVSLEIPWSRADDFVVTGLPLGDDEMCPLAPCAEYGRAVSAGGIY